MKFSHLVGLAAVALMTTAVAKQATTTPAPAASAAPAAPASVAPAAPASVAAAAPAEIPAAVAAAPEAPATPGDAKAGQTKAGACAACHGIDGNAADPQYPRLAGQHERYIARQLHLFKSGQRQNPIMQGMAAPLSAQDMRDIGAFYATQKGQAGVADDTVIATGPNADKKFYQVGEKLYRAGRPADGLPACMACHGPAGRGNPGPTYPSLGGQHAAYTVAKLQFFRDGGSYGTGTEANVVMAQVAKQLSDEEIQALGTYLQGLHAATPAATAKAE
jgi:cytochrome c553